MRLIPFLLLIVLLISVKGITQSKTVVVVDSITLQAIPYVSAIVLKSTIGWSANADGKITIDLRKVELSDILLFRAIGYENKILKFSEIYKLDTVFVAQSITQLSEVKIKAPRYKRARLGRKKAAKDWGGSGLGVIKNAPSKEAKFIPNDIGADGIIREIRVFIRFGSEYPFEVDILDVNQLTGEPEESLIKEPIKVIAKKNKKWVTIDVKKRNIHIPETGFFIAIKWIVDSANIPPIDYYTYHVYYQAEDIHRVDTFFYRGTVVANNYEKEPNWWINNDSSWRNFWQNVIDFRDTCSQCIIDNPSMNNHNYRTSNKATLAVYANILYSKSAKKYEENILDKEGVVSEKDQVEILSVNHLFVEEDKLLYPQKDVFELFASIKRALDSNELNYIVHHLLYYDYQSIEGFNIKLNKTDRGKIIYDIEEILANKEKLILTKLGYGFYEFSFDNRIFGKLLLQNGEWKLGVEARKETRIAE